GAATWTAAGRWRRGADPPRLLRWHLAPTFDPLRPGTARGALAGPGSGGRPMVGSGRSSFVGPRRPLEDLPAVTRSPPAPVAPAIPRALPWILLLLTVFGPFSMDLYLPALPALTLELEASTSVAQLTVTAC